MPLPSSAREGTPDRCPGKSLSGKEPLKGLSGERRLDGRDTQAGSACNTEPGGWEAKSCRRGFFFGLTVATKSAARQKKLKLFYGGGRGCVSGGVFPCRCRRPSLRARCR